MIPKTFTLVNRKWLVRIETNKQFQRHLDRHYEGEEAELIKGLCDEKNNRILVNKDCHTNQGDMENTFWHELEHALLFAEGKMDHDEVKVERRGGLYHEFDKTRR